MKYDFVLCESCASKPGTPLLCPSCLNNRQAITELRKQTGLLASAMTKSAPDLVQELIRRHEASNLTLDEFVEYIRHE